MRRKWSKQSALHFDMNVEQELLDLYRDLNNHTYTTSPSIAFVVMHPKPREVFAANFRDRIVHHWIALKLAPIMEECLIPNTFSCMPKRGTDAMQKEARRIFENNAEMWYLKLDISGFFNSIDKAILWNKIKTLIYNQYLDQSDKEELLWLVEETIMHDVSKDCILHCPKSLWDSIPANRTLFNNKTKGMAIGNLVSQMYANYYLNDIDHYCYTKYRGYLRYVDDMVLVDTRENLLKAIPIIRAMLSAIGLKLNEKKVQLQPICRGVDVVGKVIKGKRMYTRERTKKAALRKLPTLPFEKKNLCYINSYLGFFKNSTNFKTRKEIALSLDKSWTRKGYFDKEYTRFTFNRYTR